MKKFDPHDYRQLRRQIAFQRKHQWDMETSIQWKRGIDLSRYFLPLDDSQIALPGANEDQRRAISQYMGLVVNSTISEMESVLGHLRYYGWESWFENYPVNDEMRTLGELFFEEEEKHSRTFNRFIDLFCTTSGVQRDDLDRILPKAFGSFFKKAIIRNARQGGHSFWWLVARVEEISVKIWQPIYQGREYVDPLFYEVHQRHFEEESRHTSYAFLMLEMLNDATRGFAGRLRSKSDMVMSEVACITWVLAELHKFLSVKEISTRHPFFETLASCIPLLKNQSPVDLIRRLFVSSPYVSLILNSRNHTISRQAARRYGVWALPQPKPAPSKTFVVKDAV